MKDHVHVACLDSPPRTGAKLRNFFAAGAAILFICVAYSDDRPENVEWPSYGGDLASTKYSPIAQIDAENFGGLRVAWTWRSPDEAPIRDHPDDRLMRRARFKATPLMVGGALYLSTGLGQIAAIDAATGETRWVFDPESYVGGAPASAVGFLTRGVRLLERWKRRARSVRHLRRIPNRPRREDRKARP